MPSLNLPFAPYPILDAWMEDAENLYEDRADLSLARSRQMAELYVRWAEIQAGSSGWMTAEGRRPSLFDRIRALRLDGQDRRALNYARFWGNEALHVTSLSPKGPSEWV